MSAQSLKHAHDPNNWPPECFYRLRLHEPCCLASVLRR